jgi:hypothetical protein
MILSRRFTSRQMVLCGLATGIGMSLLLFGGLYAEAGWYGVNVLLRRGGTTWETVTPDSSHLSASMRLALRETAPDARASPFEWRHLAKGLDVAEMPVQADGQEVDRVLLTRIEPAEFDFEVRNASAGNKGLDDWMHDLGAVAVINGSYYSRHGTPDTPLRAAGIELGPTDYQSRHGAFVATNATVTVRDLALESWKAAFSGAHDAMVSYPLLLAPDGSNRVNADRRWLANRSFVGQDENGRIILGTTTDAFFSLSRLAAFLRTVPLGLTTALNLDGGPVACQGVSFGEYQRHFCGRWETQTRGADIKLLGWRFGTWALPIVLAVVPKSPK